MEAKIFSDFDLSGFWDDSDYALQEYVGEFPTGELVASIEDELGYKLPASYIELCRIHNGGIPRNTCFPTTQATSWADDHVAITGIMGIGKNKTYSLCGDLGSPFMIEEWEYPPIGVVICNCPSAGHDLIMLDYTDCGKEGEPQVVHVDQENEYKITYLAKNFEAFIRGLVNEEVYDTSKEDLANSLNSLQTGSFSGMLQEFFRKEKDTDFDKILRNILTKLTHEKGYLALHADELSLLVYDIQFYLYSNNHSVRSAAQYLKAYPQMMALNNDGISMVGYAPGFVEEWLAERISGKQIKKGLLSGMKFNWDYEELLWDKISDFE